MSTIKLQVRRDTSANWTSINPILLPGELGFEIDTGKLKIGRTAIQHWNDIGYIVSEGWNTPITPGTATKISYNSNGLVLSGTTLIASDIPDLAWGKITSGKPTTLTGYGITDAYTKTTIDANYATKVHSHPISEIAAGGTPSLTTYLRGDGNWATVVGGSGGSGTSTIVSEIITNWTSGGEVVLSHNIERDGNRVCAAYQEKSAAITDNSWSFNSGVDANWSGGRLLNYSLTTPDGQNSTTVYSTDASQISTIPWTTLSAATVSDNNGVIKDSLLLHAETYPDVDITGFEESVSGGFITNAHIQSNRRAYITTSISPVFGTSCIYFPAVTNGTTGQTTFNTTKLKDIGTGDFTVECWVRLKTQKYNCFFDFRQNSASNAGVACQIAGNGKLSIYTGGGEGVFNTTLPLNTWTHVCIERYNGVCYGYVNGVKETTTFNMPQSMGANTRHVGIGGCSNYEEYGVSMFDGYIDELRVSNVARYQAQSFTVASSQFTTDSNTLILCHFDGTNNSTGPWRIKEETGKVVTNNVVDYGMPSLDFSDKVTGTSSLIFGGARSLVTVPGGLQLGTGDFTFEMWFKVDPAHTTQDFAFFDPRSGGGFLMGISPLGNGNKVGLYDGSWHGYGSVVTYDVWHHVAYVRVSGVVHIYYDGSEVGTISNTGNWNDYVLYFGRNNDSGNFVNGKHDRIRISKIARYTGNFTPPTDTITPDSNDMLVMNCDAFSSNPLYINDTSGKQVVLNNISGLTSGKFGNAFNFRYGKPLVIAHSSDFNIQNGDFTIDFWFKIPTGRTDGVTFLSKGTTAGGCASYLIQYYSGTFRLHTTGLGSACWYTSAVTNDVWHHLEISRQGSTYRLFLDGILSHTNTDTNVSLSDSSYDLIIGGREDSSFPWNGQMDEIRFTKGLCRHTESFTLADAPYDLLQTTNISIKYALSFDGRATWKMWNGTSWVTIDSANLATQGMTASVMNAISAGNWSTIFTSGTLDLATYMSTDNADLQPAISGIAFSVTSNYWESIPGHQLTTKLMPTDTRFIQNIGGTINRGKVLVSF